MSAASNPYEPAPGRPLKPLGAMQYMRSFHYVFENPNWITNLFFVGLCLLSTGVIPVLGQLVCTGYQFGVVEGLHRRPGSQYPDFDMNKLLDYLVRGFWIFLVGLVIGLAMLPVFAGLAVLFFAIVAGAGAASGDDGAAIAMMIVLPILVLVTMAIGIAVNMLCVPFMLRVGLTQEFGAAFDFQICEAVYPQHVEGDDSLRIVHDGGGDASGNRWHGNALHRALLHDEHHGPDAGASDPPALRTSPWHEVVTRFRSGRVPSSFGGSLARLRRELSL